MHRLPYHVGADIALSVAGHELKVYQHLEGQAKTALERIRLAEETLGRWMRKWGH